MTYRDDLLSEKAERLDRRDPTVTSFDDVLGPSANRYLATGYKRVGRSFRSGTIVIDNGVARAETTGSATYPSDWSVKTPSERLAPHLSSIDAIVISEALALHAVIAIGGQDAHLAYAPWIQEVELRASASPVRFVHSVPIDATLIPAKGASVNVRCTIGTLRVHLVVGLLTELRMGDSRLLPLLPFTEDTSSTTQRDWVTDLCVPSPDGLSIAAQHRPNGSAEPSLTYVDLLRLSAQQAQVLIYQRDGISREQAATLWMRRARFSAMTPKRPVGPQGFTMAVDLVKELTLGRGEQRWRAFDVEAAGANAMTASASLAYSLSSEQSPETPH